MRACSRPRLRPRFVSSGVGAAGETRTASPRPTGMAAAASAASSVRRHRERRTGHTAHERRRQISSRRRVPRRTQVRFTPARGGAWRKRLRCQQGTGAPACRQSSFLLRAHAAYDAHAEQAGRAWAQGGASGHVWRAALRANTHDTAPSMPGNSSAQCVRACGVLGSSSARVASGAVPPTNWLRT